MRVIHLHRRPFPGSFSIEGLFDSLRWEMTQQGIDIEQKIAPRYSKGLFNRIMNVRWASTLRADVLHITGDIHYVAQGLIPQRTLLTIHDIVRLEQLKGIRRILMQEMWFRRPLHRCGTVTVISEETRRKLLARFPFADAKMHVIPDCVDTAFQDEAKNHWPETAEVLLIGTKANKNLPRTLEAMKGLPVRIHVIGRLDSELRSLFQATAIPFRNSCDLSSEQMRRAYADADFLCFASLAEGFGMPILEAQGMKRPVITSNCSSMPEVAGEGAILVDPTSAESIRDGAIRMIRHAELREALIQKGSENIQRFHPSKIAGRYIDLYQRIHERTLSRSTNP
jgi:glycosyltransferase involved in cell wall biosynthesis